MKGVGRGSGRGRNGGKRHVYAVAPGGGIWRNISKIQVW